MNHFDNIEKFEGYNKIVAERLVQLDISEEDRALLLEWSQVFGKMLEDRKCLFEYLSIIKDSFGRMSSIVGTDWDEKLLASMKKTLGDKD